MSYLNLNKMNNSEKIFSLSSNNLSIKDDFFLTEYNNDNRNNNKIAQFILGKKIGQGAFATVRLATHTKTKSIVAIKILEKQKLKECDKKRLEKEIKILKKVRHKNIVNLYNVTSSKKVIYIIMEYVKGIELLKYINDKKRLTEPESCYFYQQIISGLEYLEKLKIVHRDLKPENIIIENNKNIKIIDFGLSNIYPQNNILFSSCGSPCYAPPEMIMGKNYSGSGVDIWSSGIVLYAMLCGYLPFTDPDEQKLYKKILEKKINFPYYLTEQSKDLLNKLLDKNPLTRINIEKIKKHPWFNIINTKITMSPGLLINEIITPIDLDIINLMVNNYRFNENEIKINLLKNKHNYITTTYYILLGIKIKNNEKSIADLKSNEYLEYINDQNNFLSHYNYDINKVIEERVFKNSKEIQFYNLKTKKINTYNKYLSDLSLNINNESKPKKEEVKIFNKKIIKAENNNLDIDNKEEYICENITNKPIIKADKKHFSKINDFIFKNIKKRNLSHSLQEKYSRNNKYITNTTYTKKSKMKICKPTENNINKKKRDEKLSKNINVKSMNFNNYKKYAKKRKNKTLETISIDINPKRNESLIKTKIFKKTFTDADDKIDSYIDAKKQINIKKENYNKSIINNMLNKFYINTENSNNYKINHKVLNSFESKNKKKSGRASSPKKYYSKKLYVRLKKQNGNCINLEKRKYNEVSGVYKTMNKTNYLKLDNNNNLNKSNNEENKAYIDKKDCNFVEKEKNKKLEKIDIKQKILIVNKKEKYSNKRNKINTIKRNRTVEKNNHRINLNLKNNDKSNLNNKNILNDNTKKDYICKNNSLYKDYKLKNINIKNIFQKRDIMNFEPFDLNTIFIKNNLKEIYLIINNCLKINKINFTKNKNRYICFAKNNKFEISINKIDGFSFLYYFKIFINKNTLNKLVYKLINNIINSIIK